MGDAGSSEPYCSCGGMGDGLHYPDCPVAVHRAAEWRAGSSQPADTRIEAIRQGLTAKPYSKGHDQALEDALAALAAVAAELAETNERYAIVRRAYGIEAQERGRLEGELDELREALGQAQRVIRDLLDGGSFGDYVGQGVTLEDAARAALPRGASPRAAMTDIPEEGDERFSARYSDYVKFIEAGGGPLERR